MKPDSEMMIVGEISDYTEITIKNGKFAGQLMGTFSLSDETGHADCVIFSKELDYYQGAVYDGNIVMIKCKKSSRGGVIVSKIFEV
jgi:DNA polymerase III alpha subunit